MHKILFLIAITALLASGGCHLPVIRIPIYTYQRIVPECSGRITDLNGKPLKGVRVRITSYGVVESAYSDADGNFKLKPLYKWVQPQRVADFYEENFIPKTELPTVAGFPSRFFGTLGLFVECEKESFVLLEHNDQPMLYSHVAPSWHIFVPNIDNLTVSSSPIKAVSGMQDSSIKHIDPNKYHSVHGFFYCKKVNKRIKFVPTKKTGMAGVTAYLPEILFYPVMNPLDQCLYFFEKQYVIPKKEIKKYEVKTTSAILTFDPDFLVWLKK